MEGGQIFMKRANLFIAVERNDGNDRRAECGKNGAKWNAVTQRGICNTFAEYAKGQVYRHVKRKDEQQKFQNTQQKRGLYE